MHSSQVRSHNSLDFGVLSLQSLRDSYLSPLSPTSSLIPKILFLVLNFVTAEQRDEFVLKRCCLVVLALVLDVVDHIGDVRLADRERSVAVLPGEGLQARKCVVNPFGRTAFDELHRLGWSDGWWRSQQNVNVILDASNALCLHVILASNAAEKLPDSRFDVRGDPSLAPLRAEDDVVMERGVGVRHECVSERPLATRLGCNPERDYVHQKPSPVAESSDRRQQRGPTRVRPRRRVSLRLPRSGT